MAIFGSARTLNIIIPQAQMSYESIAHEAEGIINYCFSKIQQIVQKNLLLVRNLGTTQFNRYRFVFQSQQLSLLVGYNQSECSIDNRPLVGFYKKLISCVQ